MKTISVSAGSGNMGKCTVTSLDQLIINTQNLGPKKLVKKLSSRQIFDKPNPSPRWRRKRQAFDDPENHVVQNLSKVCQAIF